MASQLIKNILVAINGSKTSVHAAMYSIILAKQFGFNIKVVYVVDTATIKLLSNSKFLAFDEREDYQKSLEHDGKRYLDYVESLAKSKGVKIEKELRSGSISTEVIKCADESKIDLILVGGSENPGVYIETNQDKRSSTIHARREIVKYSHCPVLVIHKPDIEGLFKSL